MSFWTGRNVFFTGATGLLGSWMIEELVARGAEITCLIRDRVPGSRLHRSGLYDQVNVVHGELEDLPLLVRALNEYESDTVFHLGAQTIVGAASRSPIGTFEANIRGTWNLLEAARENAKLVSRVVVASSDKAYGAHENLPYSEDTPLVGRFPYDVSKSCTDLLSFSYFHTYGLPVSVTRCGNLYGGGDLNYNRLIPGTIRSAFLGERPIIRSDGKFVRDYFYVQEAAEAYLRLAEAMDDPSIHGEAFNFSTETPTSVIDLVQLILETMDRTDLEPVILDEASREIPRQTLSGAKAKRTLGYEAKIGLEEGLRKTIEWYRERPECQG